MLKVTARKPVRIYANVVSFKKVHLGEGIYGEEPANRLCFVLMRSGESRSDISILLGVHPSFLPGEATDNVEGEDFVPYRPGQISPAFQALVQVEEV